MSDPTSFSQLTSIAAEGKDFEVEFLDRRSRVLVLAPHGGRIEPHTDEIATRIAGSDSSYYVFRALSHKRLHLTSHQFDEPRCLDLVFRHEVVLAVHGWGAAGERACLGGLNHDLRERLSSALKEAGLQIVEAPPMLQALEPRNIVNRGPTGGGVQIEMTMEFRRNGQAVQTLVNECRRILGVSA